MKILNGIDELPYPLSRSVTTIGKFDGVHLGHRKLLSEVIYFSKKLQIPSVVMTFSPHPRFVLSPSSPVPPFCPLFDKQDQKDVLKEIGIDYFIIESFSKELAQKTAHTFFQDWICKPFNPKVIIVGHDFAFGFKRHGTLDRLKEMTSYQNIKLQVIPPVTLDKQIVSTGYIRQQLVNNDVATAAKFLGRPFYLRGILQKNDTQQRYIFQSQKKAPLKGVFQTQLLLKNGIQYSSVTTINKNTEILIRAEQAANDLIGQEVQLHFIARISSQNSI